jgi:hypothetical protein
MKLTVHHLPTGCTWTIESADARSYIESYIRNNDTLNLGDRDGTKYFFPKEIVSQCVIKVVE